MVCGMHTNAPRSSKKHPGRLGGARSTIAVYSTWYHLLFWHSLQPQCFSMSSDWKLAAYRSTGLSYIFWISIGARQLQTDQTSLTPILTSCQRNSLFITLIAPEPPTHPLPPEEMSPRLLISSRLSSRQSSTGAGYTTSPRRETATVPAHLVPSVPRLTSPRHCSRLRTCAALATPCSCTATAWARASVL